MADEEFVTSSGVDSATDRGASASPEKVLPGCNSCGERDLPSPERVVSVAADVEGCCEGQGSPEHTSGPKSAKLPTASERASDSLPPPRIPSGALSAAPSEDFRSLPSSGIGSPRSRSSSSSSPAVLGCGVAVASLREEAVQGCREDSAAAVRCTSRENDAASGRLQEEVELRLPVASEAVSLDLKGSADGYRDDPALPSKPGKLAPGCDQEAEERQTAVEKELTKEVPHLLESMNRASSDVNAFERQATEAQDRYRHLLEQWSRLHEEMRSVYGQSLETARPYFEASQALSIASHHAQGIACEFSAAASQHSQAKAELRSIEERFALGGSQVRLDAEQQEGLSRATVRVLRTQQFRDKCEQEYARILRDYQEAQNAVEIWRTELGDAVIRRTLPCFRQLQQHQAELKAAQNRIGALVERAKASKHTYHSSLRELDRINVAVHSARQSPSAKSVDTAVGGEKALAFPKHRQGGLFAMPPEVSPEMCEGGEQSLEDAIVKQVGTNACLGAEEAFGPPEEVCFAAGGWSSDDGPFS